MNPNEELIRDMAESGTINWDKAYTSRPIYYFSEPPQIGAWECEMFGMGRSLVLKPAKGNEPNWFHRWMQRIFFGNKWSKV